MKIKIEVEVDTSQDMDERDALLDLLQEIKEHLQAQYEEDL